MASTKPKPRFVPKQSEEGSRKCARAECGKTVYQLEELKCLDKLWHKQCFRCSVCGMLLNMKNYKGYNKMPYCEPHYPKTVATVVKDTPEMLRVAENTKNQSLVQYHMEYEKTKGRKTDVTDDPETQRHVKNMQFVSQVAYTHEQERREAMEKSRPSHEPLDKLMQGKYVPKSPTEPNAPVAAAAAPPTQKTSKAGASVRPVGSIADYDPLGGQWGSAATPQHQTQQKQQLQQQQQQQQRGAPPQTAGHTAAAPTSPKGKAGLGKKCTAMYDYTAADTDEVSFVEGDVLMNCQRVDDGWMTGTVQRTKQWGMLPANYVQPAAAK